MDLYSDSFDHQNKMNLPGVVLLFPRPLKSNAEKYLRVTLHAFSGGLLVAVNLLLYDLLFI